MKEFNNNFINEDSKYMSMDSSELLQKKIRFDEQEPSKKLTKEQQDRIDKLFKDVLNEEKNKERNKEENTYGINALKERIAKEETSGEIDINLLENYDKNPFRELDDENIKELEASIEDEGLINPLILWKKDGKYIILSGHNRVKALKNLGYQKLDKSMYIIKENISEDDAMLIVVDSNMVQRKNMLPSERAKAYAIQQKVLSKKDTKRTEVFAFFSEENALDASNFKTFENLFHDETNEKRVSIWRYLRLNYLISKLLEKVDEKEISIVIGVELSYLSEETQEIVYNVFFEENEEKLEKLSLSICKKIREKEQTMKINKEVLQLIIESIKKPKNSRTFKLNFKDIRELSKRELKTDKEAKEYILEAIKFYEENNCF